MIHIDSLADLADDVMREYSDNPLLAYNHLPGANGIRPGPQELFHNCKSKIKILCGGNRAGKTVEGAEYFLTKAHNIPNGRGWCACPSHQVSVEKLKRGCQLKSE